MYAATGKKGLALCGLVVLCGAVLRADAPDGAKPERYVPTAAELQEGYRRAQRTGQSGPRVYKAQIAPHWFHGDARFWYRNDLRGGTKEFVLVDAEKGTRGPAFDHAKLAAALAKATGEKVQPDRLPFDRIDFTDDDRAVRFQVGRTSWKCDLSSYACTRGASGPDPEPPAAPAPDVLPTAEDVARQESPWPDGLSPDAAQVAQQPRREREPERTRRSPDGKWVAFVRDDNVYVRSQDDGKEVPLSKDGKPGLAYGMLQWSPDSQALVAFRIEPAETKDVYLIESSPKEGGRAKLHTRPYALPGDPFPSYELNVFEVAGRKQIKPDVERIDFGRPQPRWQRDGRHFTYEKVDRGHQRFRLVRVDAHTGAARNLIDEKTRTFIWTAHRDGMNLELVNFLDRSDEIIYVSERDGWRHLYLVDARDGTVKNRITRGEWVVRGIDRIDEANRQVWFRASGRNPDQDPYLVHFYRVNFDGTGLVVLTEGNGNHAVQFSPDRKYLIDTYSRVDQPPVHELRRAADGKRVCKLDEADVAELRASGWQPPEVFTAKGRDGKTDIWGIICRPPHLDPRKNYPVIESIYAGPQGSFVPKTFSPARRFSSLTELGFIVVQIDGMGTANRSKAFHDVCWKNLKDAGFPDRILWHQAAAKKYPYYDLSRVGIYGTSAGGQNAAGAVLFHADFYKAAVAACGCHDNRMDKASWNEQWMGYPVGPQYAESSNITHAGNLRGKLLLIVGEMDTNVPPESTLRLADALIKAGKDFELLVVPGMGHSNGGPYGVRRMQDFFVRHLHGVPPPDRNADAGRAEVAQRSEDTAPDLAELVARPREPMQLVVQRYQADRGSLLRTYTVAASPARYARLRRFYTTWLDALGKLDVAGFGADGRAEHQRLLDTARRELHDLDAQAQARAAVAPLVPFAGAIVKLEEARQRMEDVDAARAAGVLNGLKKQIDHLVKTAGPVPKDLAGRAADAVSGLRQTLKSWYGFYDGYDPLFTWWVEQPYREVDQALQSYAAVLRETGVATAATEKPPATAPTPPPTGTEADVPDLRELLAFPQSEMAAVIQRYQADRSRSGLRAFLPLPPGATRSPERQERLRKFDTDWLAALGKLDFDRLSPDGQIDYLLLRNHLEQGLRRLELEGKDRPEPPGNDGGIPGRPIGRAALESELAGEMIPYTPEELIAIAEKEAAWCEAELKKASREMGCGDDWHRAVEKVKTMHVAPGKQPGLIRDLAREAIAYVVQNDLVTVPPLAAETWRMEMMSPQRQLINPFFTGGEVISVSFPTNTMAYEARLQSMRGNNIPFARATVHHELIPGHHLQGFLTARYRTYREAFTTPFWTEGWALYWEMVLYDRGFPRTPEDRVGFLFWRLHRCARILFSLNFHLGKMSAPACVDLLVERVGHERDNATAEVRRSFAGGYGPLYQAAYMLGGLQLRALRRELVDSGKMSERAFHDAVLKENRIPIALVRASLTKQPLTRDYRADWRFYGADFTPKAEGSGGR